MKVETIDPVTGTVTQIDINTLKEEDANEINRTNHTDEEGDRYIDNLDISADAKSVLKKLSSLTVKVGRVLLKIGRCILDILITLFKNYPNIGLGVLLGILLGTIIGAIPVIGAVIGALITPLAAAFGFVVGMSQDLQNKALAREIAKATKIFQPLV